MATAAELYPESAKEQEENGSFYGPGSYQPIIDSFGNVLIQVDDDGYHGDTRVILERDGKYGWLNFGWGSCSGCDALQACNSLSEIDELINSLSGQIKWFDTLNELKQYFETKDWALEYSYNQSEQQQFITQVKEYQPTPTHPNTTMTTPEKLDYFAGLALQALIAKFPVLDREGEFGSAENVSKIKSQLAESAWEYAQWMVYHSPKAYEWMRNNNVKDVKP